MTSSTRARVCVVGCANVDLVVGCASLSRPGETILAGDVERLPGGKAGNQAAALARLDLDTVLVARVGDDASGEWLLASLDRLGVDCGLVQRGGAPTGPAFIAIDNAGENQIIVSRGANEFLDVTVIYFSSFGVGGLSNF